jgi:serine/threonine protein kinase
MNSEPELPTQPPRPRPPIAVGAEAEVAAARTADPVQTASQASRTPQGSPSRGFDRLPARFGRYEVQKLLGAGGMGAVYLAHDSQLDRPVALKIPRFSGADEAHLRERFLREARAAAMLHHAHICPVHDVGEIDGVPYLTMGFIEGRSLSEVLRTQTAPLRPRAVAILLRKLALALEEAHRHRVIHRDLKPANIIVTKRGEPVVMDFGLARRGGTADPRLTHDGAIMGTPAYMAPEQARGDPNAMGPACDIYSLGVILYQLLSGRLPFTGDVLAILAQLATEEPPPPSQHRPDVDPALEAICLKAMAKSVANRYPSMSHLVAALTEYLKQAPADLGDSRVTQPPVADTRVRAVPAPETQLQPRALPDEGRPASRRWHFAILTAAGLLLLVAALGVGGAVYYLAANQETAPPANVEPDRAGHAPSDPMPDPKPKPPDPEKVPAPVPGPEAVTYIWPAEALRTGAIHPPKLDQLKPLLRDTFSDPKSGFPQSSSPLSDKGYRKGKYVLRIFKGSTETADVPVKRVSPPAGSDFAIEVVAEATGYATRWGIVIVDRDNPAATSPAVLLLGTGLIYAGPDPGGAAEKTVALAAVRHPLMPEKVKKGGAFREVLEVVVKGRFLEAYVNGMAVIDPLTLDRPIKSPRFRLTAATAYAKGNTVEFESVTIWSAESVPALEARGAIAVQGKPPSK